MTLYEAANLLLGHPGVHQSFLSPAAFNRWRQASPSSWFAAWDASRCRYRMLSRFAPRDADLVMVVSAWTAQRVLEELLQRPVADLSSSPGLAGLLALAKPRGP